MTATPRASSRLSSPTAAPTSRNRTGLTARVRPSGKSAERCAAGRPGAVAPITGETPESRGQPSRAPPPPGLPRAALLEASHLALRSECPWPQAGSAPAEPPCDPLRSPGCRLAPAMDRASVSCPAGPFRIASAAAATIAIDSAIALATLSSPLSAPTATGLEKPCGTKNRLGSFVANSSSVVSGSSSPLATNSSAVPSLSASSRVAPHAQPASRTPALSVTSTKRRFPRLMYKWLPRKRSRNPAIS
mmetsp:Transcript_11648/g.45315  ORF Transcript_11648/g.45315 Transcript_11648/m.45315 type:complete len:247 (+) Transcript_11648:771-1511(+)